MKINCKNIKYLGPALVICFIIFIISCKKQKENITVTPPVTKKGPLNFIKATINGSTLNNSTYYNVSTSPTIQISFSAAINPATVAGNIALTTGSNLVPLTYSYANSDSILIIQRSTAL